LPSRILSENLKNEISKTIILPVGLNGYETWSLTVRGECRLRVFKNRIWLRIFRLEKNKNEEWRRLHSEEIHSTFT
jgi:hypothetical protein